jgi:hypothetical protein
MRNLVATDEMARRHHKQLAVGIFEADSLHLAVAHKVKSHKNGRNSPMVKATGGHWKKNFTNNECYSQASCKPPLR